MRNLNVCPHCGERKFHETPTGRRCSSCGFTVTRPANGGAGGKGHYCYICHKYQVFHGKCRSCGAKESFT